MGNQREIRQVLGREGLGVVIAVRAFHSDAVRQLLNEAGEQGTFYTYFCPANERIEFPNLDGQAVSLSAKPCDHIVIQSGGKMWCGYEEFVNHIRHLSPHLEDALFYVGDEIDYIDEFRITGGVLDYRRVHQGGWRPLEDFLKSKVFSPPS